MHFFIFLSGGGFVVGIGVVATNEFTFECGKKGAKGRKKLNVLRCSMYN